LRGAANLDLVRGETGKVDTGLIIGADGFVQPLQYNCNGLLVSRLVANIDVASKKELFARRLGPLTKIVTVL
jgi:hypothetical protein